MESILVSKYVNKYLIYDIIYIIDYYLFDEKNEVLADILIKLSTTTDELEQTKRSLRQTDRDLSRIKDKLNEVIESHDKLILVLQRKRISNIRYVLDTELRRDKSIGDLKDDYGSNDSDDYDDAKILLLDDE